MFEPLPNTRGSVLYAGGNEGTVVKEPLKALVNEWIIHKGVYHNPS